MENIEGKEIDVGEVTDELFKQWEEGYEKGKDGWHCCKCDSKIQQTTCYISVHFKEFSKKSMGGGGEVRHAPYPYCPKCEGKPKMVRGHVWV